MTFCIKLFPRLRNLDTTSAMPKHAILLPFALLLMTVCLGCAKSPAVTFEHQADVATISHQDFLKLLDERYTSYEHVPGFKTGPDSRFDKEAYHSQNPNQDHFPNSIRFYETPCVASREIMMAKGDVRLDAQQDFRAYMEQWETGGRPERTMKNMRYVADLTVQEREKKTFIFQSVRNYCQALGGSVVNKTAIGEEDQASFFLPTVAHCQTPDDAHSFMFVYNPNVLNNAYGYMPQKLPRHSLTPYHQKKKDGTQYYGYSTTTMIRATPECLRRYPVEYAPDTGELTFGWDGYFLFIHPEHPKASSERKAIYFDRFRKNWVDEK